MINCKEITEVTDKGDWFEISRSGLMCGLNKKYGFVPKVGDLLIVQTNNLNLISGMYLNGICIFLKSEKELLADGMQLMKMIRANLLS